MRYWGFQENFLEEKTGSPPPFILPIYKVQSTQFIPKKSQFELYTLIRGSHGSELGVSCVHEIFGFVSLAFAIIPARDLNDCCIHHTSG